jgi:hypothetical protein
MYHTHDAEILHDKIYALLGMCSDRPMLPREASLEPNYKLEWKILMQRLIQFLLGSNVTVKTWNDKAIAVIRSKGCIIGNVTSVESKPSSGGNSQCIEAIFRSASPEVSNGWGRSVQSCVRWTLWTYAKSIQPGDLICFLEGAPEPTILRLHKGYFIIVMIKAILPERIQSTELPIQRSDILQSAHFTRDLLLVWDWENFMEKSQDESTIWIQKNSSTSEDVNKRFETRFYSMTTTWDAAVSQGLDRTKQGQEKFCKIAEDYVETEHPGMQSEAARELLLHMDKTAARSNGQYSELFNYAVLRGHSTMVKILIGPGGVDVNAHNSNSHPLLLEVAEKGREAVVKLLLEAGANVDPRSFGWTPLMLAAANGHEAVVKLLLEAKANVEREDLKYRTPLLWAAKNGHETIVKLLLEAKANINSRDSEGCTPLAWAAKNGHEAVVNLLLKAKADVDKKSGGPPGLWWVKAKGREATVKVQQSWPS